MIRPVKIVKMRRQIASVVKSSIDTTVPRKAMATRAAVKRVGWLSRATIYPPVFWDPVIVTYAHVLLAICMCSNLKNKRKQRFDVWPLNSVRISQGQFIYLTSGLQSDELFDYFRMRTSSLDALLSYVRNDLTRQTSDAQTPVPLEDRLAEMQESSTLGRSRERSGRPTWPTSCDNMVSGSFVARTPRTENALSQNRSPSVTERPSRSRSFEPTYRTFRLVSTWS